MHPLLESLSNLTDNELEQKITNANKMYWQTNNPDVRQQVTMVIESYKQELETRRINQRLKQQENGNSDLDNLINIS
jgi:hypothetical protein